MTRPIRLAVAAAALACGRASDAADAPGCLLVHEGHGTKGEVAVTVERVASGLEVPWALAFLPGGDALVTERPGRIRLLRAGRLEPEPVATVAGVAAEGEGGLLGLAVDPRFAENRRFYTYHTARAGERTVNRVTRWTLAPDARSARVDRVILDGIPAARFHDGGRLRFGPDGLLYVGTGDATEPARAQDRTSLAGKLLRVTVDGGVPGDNPFPGSPIFLLGLRNPQGFDFLDPATLVVADHGPSGELGRRGHDEVNVVRAGANLGWPDVWSCEARAGVTSPSLVWNVATPPGGAVVYRGDAVAGWKGSVLVGVLGAHLLARVQLGPDGRVLRQETYLEGMPPAGLGRVRDVEQGPDGALWATTSNCDGRAACPPQKDVVVRIVAR